MLDYDAAFSSEVPYTIASLNSSEIADAISAINVLTAALDVGAKRGRNAVKTIAAIQNELSNGRLHPIALDNSPAKSIIYGTGRLAATDLSTLKTALTRDKPAAANKILNKANIFVWSSTLEDILLRDPACESVIESTLISLGELSGSLSSNPNRRATLKNSLHGVAYKPHVLRQVVIDLDTQNCFKKGEVEEVPELLTAEARESLTSLRAISGCRMRQPEKAVNSKIPLPS